MSLGCALLILMSKGQGHGALLHVIGNGFGTITDSVIHVWSWNFIHHVHMLPMSEGCTLLILGSKGQGHGALVIENAFWTISDSVIHLWNLIYMLPMSKGCALLFLGSKGQRSRWWGIGNWKWCSVIHLWSWNFILLLLMNMSQGCALLILGSKVLGYLGLKIVKDVPCSFKGFLQLGFLHLW